MNLGTSILEYESVLSKERGFDFEPVGYNPKMFLTQQIMFNVGQI